MKILEKLLTKSENLPKAFNGTSFQFCHGVALA
jgi:hypothetical protein